MKPGDFVWYELTTSDPHAAADFYAKVVGWSFEESPTAGQGITYLLGKTGERPAVGVMSYPPDMPKPGITRWWGYVLTEDVDAKAKELESKGGVVRRAPEDIPGIGRFAVVADPQGQGFMLFSGAGDPPPELAYMTPGTVGWHELSAKDWEPMFDFYAGLFGWEKDTPMDMGGQGVYQLVKMNDAVVGAMLTSPGPQPTGWAYYFAVDDIDAAKDRLEAAGGTVAMGPTEVPGPVWIIIATDPQGGGFALVGPRNA
jgi:uncharacterized protein